MRSLLLLLSLVGLATASARSGFPRCRCTVDEPCWPDAREQETLSRSLTHPLIQVKPIGTPCHDPSFNAAACDNVISNFHTGLWRADQIGASMYPTSEESEDGQEHCYPDGTRTGSCQQGRVPLLGVNVSTTRDVQKSVQFAAKHNLKMVIKSSGHGVYRSMGNGSLLVWTHHLKKKVFTQSFTPAGAPPHTSRGPAVTIGSGVQWGELYDAVAAHNHTIVGGYGAGGSVGAGGGWPQGGGHSALSPYYGLGADNVLEFEVVLANGSVVVANEFRHTDLFWAMRGGGGPSFGIATSVTYRLHPQASLVSSYFVATTDTQDAFVSLLDAWHAVQGNLSKDGWAGFYPFTNGTFTFTYAKLNGTVAEANATYNPLFAQFAAIPGVKVVTAVNVAYATFHDWYSANWQHGSAQGVGYNYTLGDPVGVYGLAASRLLPQSLLDDPAGRSNLTRQLAALPGGRGFLVGGGAVAAVAPDAISANPAFRSTLIDMTFGTGYIENTPAPVIAAMKTQLTAWAQGLRDLTPGGGTYLNEADENEPNFTEAFWGENYPRLVQIKKKYDPHNLFMTATSVGSDHWDSGFNCQLTPF